MLFMCINTKQKFFLAHFNLYSFFLQKNIQIFYTIIYLFKEYLFSCFLSVFFFRHKLNRY